MTFSASWSGKGRDFPGIGGLVLPGLEQLSDIEVEHVRHLGHVAEHLGDEHPKDHFTISITGWVSGADTGANISVSTSTPAQEVDLEQLKATDEAATSSPASPQGDGLTLTSALNVPAEDGPAVADPEGTPAADPAPAEPASGDPGAPAV